VALYLSPHLDDVALSCPARLRDLRASGWRVVVLSLFTEGSAQHADRRAEDARALKLLDVEGRHAGLRDAPFRHPRYRSLAALCLRRHPEDHQVQPEVERAVEAALAELQPSEVVAPLGVGGHVDHRLVHAAARAVVPPAQLSFYEDRPYALVRGATELRLRELGASDAATSPIAHLAAFLRAPYVKTYLRADDLRALPGHLRGPAVAPPPSRWSARVERHPLGERGMAMAVGLAYGSQWPELFRSLGEHERVLRAGAAALGAAGAYAERFWRLEG
jgi:LmbE family N-acetylglucosaminyl deacetylase